MTHSVTVFAIVLPSSLMPLLIHFSYPDLRIIIYMWWKSSPISSFCMERSIRGLRRRKTSTSSSTWEEDAKKNKDRSEYQEDDAEDYCYHDLYPPSLQDHFSATKKNNVKFFFFSYEGKEYLALLVLKQQHLQTRPHYSIGVSAFVCFSFF